MDGELIAIFTLLCVIAYQGWFIRDVKNHFHKIERDLLDRVMSRNYETYVQGDVVRNEIKKSLTPEEIYELQQERGIPV